MTNSYIENQMQLNADGSREIIQVEIPFWPLDESGVAVTLLVVKGFITLEEGANVTHLSQDHLTHEAEAWAVASEA